MDLEAESDIGIEDEMARGFRKFFIRSTANNL